MWEAEYDKQSASASAIRFSSLFFCGFVLALSDASIRRARIRSARVPTSFIQDVDFIPRIRVEVCAIRIWLFPLFGLLLFEFSHVVQYSYVQYSAVAARCVRQALKGNAKIAGDKKNEASLFTRTWKDGVIGAAQGENSVF